MQNEKSISIKEEQTNEMCPEPTTMFLDDPLGVYWSTDQNNEDCRPNFGWDENENNNAVVNTLLHTILEAESECCPPPLLVSKEELFPDHTLGISCITDFIKEDPELNLEADETENYSYETRAMDHQETTYIKEEETDRDPDEPGLMYPEDPLKAEVPGLPIKTDPELKFHVATSENDFPEDPLKPEVPGLPIKPDPELKLHVATAENDSYGTLGLGHLQTTYVKKEETDCAPDEPGLMFPEDPLKPEVPGLPIKPDPELKLHVATAENDVVASRNDASNSTGLLQSNKRCEFPVEETESQGVSENELEIGSEESTHFIMFREGEEEEKEGERLTAPRLKCSLRENKCQTFTCSFCLQSLTSKYRLMMHVFVHIDGVEPPKYVCKSCAEVFPSYVRLKKHLKISEAEQDSSADKEETFDCSGKSFTDLGVLKGQASIHTGRQPHKCVICGKSFTLLGNLKKHSLIHTRTRPHKCDICGKSFTQLGTLKNHSLTHTGTRPHKCSFCGKSFTRLDSLKTHSLIHTGTKPHKCDICGKYFTQWGTLKKHSLIHTGRRPHKCDICGKSFTQWCTLKTHLLIHTGTKPHNCDICDKSFTQSGNLKKHSLIHTRKKHKCDICGKSFTVLVSLKKHSLIHTGSKPHKCGICGKSFTPLGSLKRHSLIHTGTKPHKCDICDKSFTQLGNLKKHLLIHTGTRPHKCAICGKSFTLLGSLKIHSLIHSGIRPHKCDICDKSFTQLGTLKKHLLVHTGTTPQ